MKERQLKEQQENREPTPPAQPVRNIPTPAEWVPSAPGRAKFMDIIQNKFGNQGEEASLTRYKQYHDRKLAESRIKTTIKQTKASLGRSSTVESAITASTLPPQPVFKLTKFKKIASRYKDTKS